MNARTLSKLLALFLTVIALPALADWRGDGNLRRKKVKVHSDEYTQEDSREQEEEAQEQEEEDDEEEDEAWGRKDKRFSLGLRAGYGLPFGKVAGGAGSDEGGGMGDFVSGKIPLQLDAGYFVTRNLYLGGSFQYALGLLAEDCSEPVSCSVSVMRFGLNADYHFQPREKLDPWVGLGVGYERLSLSSSITVEGMSASASLAASGFEFASLHGGADYQIAGDLFVGPFVTLTAAQYSSASLGGLEPIPGAEEDEIPEDTTIEEKAFHFWLMGGVRLRFRF